MNMHRLDLAGRTLAVREWPGEGTPVLAWHALGQAASGAFAEIIAARLAVHGLRPYAIDGPGFGESTPLPTADYTVEHLADLLLRAADALEFFRAGTRVGADGRVMAIAPAEVRGAAFYSLIRARPSLAWPVLQAAGIPGLLLLATVPEETDGTNRLFVPAFREAWPDAEVIHVDGATHSLFTELGEGLGDLIGEWAERVGIA